MSSAIIPQVVLPAALFSIMLGLGLTLKLTQFRAVFNQPRALLAGLALQLLLLPLLGWLIVTVFALPVPVAMGIIILTLAPGGATSNIVTLLSRGDTALSVSLTAVSSLITPFTLPLLAAFFLSRLAPQIGSVDFPVIHVMVKLMVMSLLPVILGMWLAYRFPGLTARLAPWVERAALVFVCFAVVLVIMANRDRLALLLIDVGPAVLSLVLLASLISLAVARFLALNEAQCWTLAIEVGIQNAATAIFVTGAVLQRPDMAATALAYGVLMNLPAVLLIIYRQRQRSALKI